MSVVRLKALLPALVSLVIITAAGIVLYRTLSTIDFAEVAARFRELPLSAIVLASCLTVLCFTMLGVYEAEMLADLRAGISWRRPFLAGLIAYPVGHAVGFGAASGGAIRYRIYAARGVSPLAIGQAIVLSTFPFAAGLGVWFAIALLIRTDEAAALLRLEPATALAIGWAVIAAHVAYVVFILRWRKPLVVRGNEVRLPSPRLTAIQYVIGLIEVACMGGVLYVLLPPDVDIGPLAFLAAFVISAFAGMISSVPAGLGVLEGTLLVLLQGIVTPEVLLGSVLAYRLIFELVPFVFGLVLFLAYELAMRREAARA